MAQNRQIPSRAPGRRNQYRVFHGTNVWS